MMMIGGASQSFDFAFRGQRASFCVSSGFKMKLAELVRLSEDVAVMLVSHEEEHLQKRGLWYGGWEVCERTHDERTRNVLFADRRYEFFYWYIGTMRGKEGGPLCEAGDCVRWADLSGVHHTDPCFFCASCWESMREGSEMVDGPVALRTRKRKAAVELTADMVPLCLKRLVRHR